MKKTLLKTSAKHMIQPFKYKNNNGEIIETTAYITMIDLQVEELKIAIVDIGEYLRAFEYRSGYNISPNYPRVKNIRSCVKLAVYNCKEYIEEKKSTVTQLAQHLPTLNN